MIGVDPQALSETVSNFNIHAEKGEDPEFGRGSHPWGAWMTGDRFNKPHPNFGTLEKGPFWAVELSRVAGSGIGRFLCWLQCD